MKIDLHTHSIASPDGALTLDDYRSMLSSGRLTHIAITDHDEIAFALDAQRHIGDAIIVGEEITTEAGEIIGLFLTERIAPGQSLVETVQQIKAQHGLVYIPHPFETVRKGITEDDLEQIAAHVDIIEVSNGRAVWQDFGTKAAQWADIHNVAKAASSDAHGLIGWGKTYAVIDGPVTNEHLVSTLKSASYSTKKVGLGILYPKLNRMRKRFGFGRE